MVEPAPRGRDLRNYLNDIGWPRPLVSRAREGVSSSPPMSLPQAGASLPQAGASLPQLEALARRAAQCHECQLCERRTTVVFGEGDPEARVLFIGEGPGADEDRTGRPFVGQAGQVLDGMIRAMGLERSRVYITNIVKCRPPGNRDPKEEEVAACSAFLDRQIELIGPEVIVALGKPAAHRLTGSRKPIGALRGRWHSYHTIPLMPVFHPAFMLRNPQAKREAWHDLKLIMRRLASTTDS